MKVEYDRQADAMYIRLAEGEVADSDEVRDGVIFDLDAAGRVLGIEILDVSRRTDVPLGVEFEALGAVA